MRSPHSLLGRTSEDADEVARFDGLAHRWASDCEISSARGSCLMRAPSQLLRSTKSLRVLAVMKNWAYTATGEPVYGQQPMAVSGQALRRSTIPDLADRTCCDTDGIPAGVVSVWVRESL